jgi:hypothetical protein
VSNVPITICVRFATTVINIIFGIVFIESALQALKDV